MDGFQGQQEKVLIAEPISSMFMFTTTFMMFPVVEATG